MTTALPPAGVAVVSIPWETTGLTGDHVLQATVDAAFAVIEADEHNNEQTLAVRVVAAAPAHRATRIRAADALRVE